MIRPRGGGFNYSPIEFESMKEDIKKAKTLGCDGFVFGVLNKKQEVDIKRCEDLLSLASPLPCTFHRAFDEVKDPFGSLEIITRLGFKRILTSGQQKTALIGANLIKKLNETSQKKIIIMPGAGIISTNLKGLIDISGCKEYHSSAKHLSPKGKYQGINPMEVQSMKRILANH